MFVWTPKLAKNIFTSFWKPKCCKPTKISFVPANIQYNTKEQRSNGLPKSFLKSSFLAELLVFLDR